MNHHAKHMEQMSQRLQERNAHIEQRMVQQQERLRSRLAQQQERLSKQLANVEAQLNGQLNTKQEKIVGAALELLREVGLNNLTLRDIAKRLNIQAPALYWHFKSKEVLIDYMAEAILHQGFADAQPRQNGESWQNWLTKQMGTLRQAMLAYPDGARVVAGAHPTIATTMSVTFEQALQSLTTDGLSLEDAAVIALTATNYTVGYVIEEQSSPSPEELAHIELDSFFARYPLTAKLLDEVFTRKTSRKDNFSAGLARIIQ